MLLKLKQFKAVISGITRVLALVFALMRLECRGDSIASMN